MNCSRQTGRSYFQAGSTSSDEKSFSRASHYNCSSREDDSEKLLCQNGPGSTHVAHDDADTSQRRRSPGGPAQQLSHWQSSRLESITLRTSRAPIGTRVESESRRSQVLPGLLCCNQRKPVRGFVGLLESTCLLAAIQPRRVGSL